MWKAQFAACLVAVAASGLWAGGALANTERAGGIKTIKACGKGGLDCVTSQVRRTALGEQYRGPNGQWRWCQGDCRDTIRKGYIEFWQYQGG